MLLCVGQSSEQIGGTVGRVKNKSMARTCYSMLPSILKIHVDCMLFALYGPALVISEPYSSLPLYWLGLGVGLGFWNLVGGTRDLV